MSVSVKAMPSTAASDCWNELSMNRVDPPRSPAKTRTQPRRTSTDVAAIAATSSQNNPISQDLRTA
jgi:hypothetical protein